MKKINYSIVTSYSIECGGNWYVVTLNRIKNTPSGNPRYSVNIIFMSRPDAPTYRFTWRGNYCSEPQEAREALNALLLALAQID